MREVLTLGWIGLGKMGGAMSPHLLGTNKPLVVFDPDADRRGALVAAGARDAASPAAVARAADAIFSIIPDARAAASLFLDAGGLGDALEAGQIVIEMSTLSPAISADIATALAARGVTYLRAPVSGSTATASSAKLTLMVSGDPAAYEAVLPLLRRFSARQFYVGGACEARYLKLVVNMMVGAMSALVGEALVFGLKGGLDLATMLDVIGESAVASPLFGYKKALLASRNYEPAFTVEQMIKDFGLIVDAAASDHTPVALTALVKQHYEEAAAQGQGGRDFFWLFERQAASAGLPAAR
jgi:3-hydroxyisobutyrate dehydrogenase-like beta-hydroxyacid dehydrogenase